MPIRVAHSTPVPGMRTPWALSLHVLLCHIATRQHSGTAHHHAMSTLSAGDPVPWLCGQQGRVHLSSDGSGSGKQEPQLATVRQVLSCSAWLVCTPGGLAAMHTRTAALHTPTCSGLMQASNGCFREGCLIRGYLQPSAQPQVKILGYILGRV